MPVDPGNFGIQDFAIPAVGAAVCDYPDPAVVKAGVAYGGGTLVGTYGTVVPALEEYSPANILRWVLIDLGIGTDPELGLADGWPVYWSSEPADPDNVLTTYDTSGVPDSPTMPDDEYDEHYGVMVRIRSTTAENPGWYKAKAVRDALVKQVYERAIVIGPRTYVVHNLSNVGSILNLGKDREPSAGSRSIFTINAMMSVTRVS